MSNCPTQEKDLLQCGTMNLRSASSTKCCGDWHSFSHSHSYTELFYAVSGKGQFQVNDRHFPIQAHQLIVVKPNVIHTVTCSESYFLEYIILGIEGLETIPDVIEKDSCVYNFKVPNHLLTCMQGILTETQSEESNSQILCHAYLDIIAAQLLRSSNSII